MPVSRLKSVLLPELGLPTTAILADGRRRTETWSAGTRVTPCLATFPGGRDRETLSLLTAERDGVAEHAEFDGVAADR